MPRLSAWFVRASIIYLAAGFTMGALMLANKALNFYPAFWQLLPAHVEFLLLGWFIQLACGVAFWILPRLPTSQPRGNEKIITLGFWLINFGIVSVSIGAISAIPGLILAGRVAELAAVLVFVFASWNRVKSFR